MNVHNNHQWDENILELLYRSFDGRLSAEEEQRLGNALANSAALQKEKERIAALRKSVSQNAAEAFQPFFAERVLQRIGAEKKRRNDAGEEFFASLLWSFRRIALPGVIAALVLLAIHLSRGEEVSLDTVLLMPQLTMEDVWELDELAEAE